MSHLTIEIELLHVDFCGQRLTVDGEYERWSDETESSFIPKLIYIYHPFSMGCSMKYDLTDMFRRYPEMLENFVTAVVMELDKREINK